MESFLVWWQHLPEHMNPVLFSLGPLTIQYYGLMYIVAFAITLLLTLYRVRTEPRFRISAEQVQDLATVMLLGVIIGGRLGYVIFYNPAYYLEHPLEIVLPFDFSNGIRFTGISGMSYHGGLIGVVLGAFVYVRRTGLSFREAADLFAPAVPLGYTFGRLGNFINGELYGRVTEAAIGMYFPLAPGLQRRHPSQLYEAVFEGLFLFGILWAFRKKQMPQGAMMAWYLMGYGGVRFFIEFTRQPDAQLGFVLGFLSMGQVLCLGMILAGIGVLAWLTLQEHRDS
jgi:phosphatidylglycerol:prolipoprotein diacylglycerol transferase